MAWPCFNSFTTASSLSNLLPSTATTAPLASNSSAVAFPMPAEPPAQIHVPLLLCSCAAQFALRVIRVMCSYCYI